MLLNKAGISRLLSAENTLVEMHFGDIQVLRWTLYPLPLFNFNGYIRI
ncbi:MAG: hypothetical protein JW827_08610 [Spirochaetes bacterium]|nr:hypothetical protein [Spirochaetota bacterium]